MHINALLLADEAEVRNDRLTVTDGGWDGLTAPAWPAAHPIKVVCLIAPSQGDVGRDLEALVTVTAPDGSPSGATEATARVQKHRAQVPVVLPVFAQFEMPGTYVLSVRLADAERSLSFVVDGPSLDVRVEDSQPV